MFAGTNNIINVSLVKSAKIIRRKYNNVSTVSLNKHHFWVSPTYFLNFNLGVWSVISGRGALQCIFIHTVIGTFIVEYLTFKKVLFLMYSYRWLSAWSEACIIFWKGAICSYFFCAIASDRVLPWNKLLFRLGSVNLRHYDGSKLQIFPFSTNNGGASARFKFLVFMFGVPAPHPLDLNGPLWLSWNGSEISWYCQVQLLFKEFCVFERGKKGLSS